ncbi:MAG: DUF2934 domain-containing protein [Betaproteobacteria bacterium]|nr:DUF2934 domain-containing protein [Betaproteobacteria bacterium]
MTDHLIEKGGSRAADSRALRSPPVRAKTPARRKTATQREDAATDTSEAQASREEMIAMAAYFIAERRGFEAGREMDDWLEAEAQIDALY